MKRRSFLKSIFGGAVAAVVGVPKNKNDALRRIDGPEIAGLRTIYNGLTIELQVYDGKRWRPATDMLYENPDTYYFYWGGKRYEDIRAFFASPEYKQILRSIT